MKNDFINCVKDYKTKLENDETGRDHSWEHCYKCFYNARNSSSPDVDYLSLQLAFYLASWGMYRGSSFLLQKDYKVHIKAVEIILNKKNDCLLGIKCEKLLESENLHVLDELVKELSSHYKEVRNKTLNKTIKGDISITLITKILLGTLGCVPALDTYFILGTKNSDIYIKNIKKGSLSLLVKFYKDNSKILEKIVGDIKFDNIIYPQMKIIDMGFWLIGMKIEKEHKIKKK